MSGEPLRPITDDEGLTAAIAEVGRLWDCPEDGPEAARLDVLASLIVAYERERYPIRTSSPVEILRYAVGDMGRTREELADLVGGRRLADQLLSGERPITRAVAGLVSEAWHLPPGLLLREDDAQTP